MTPEEIEQIATAVFSMLRADTVWNQHTVEATARKIDYDSIADNAAYHLAKREIAQELMDENGMLGDKFLSSVICHREMRSRITSAITPVVMDALNSDMISNLLDVKVEKATINTTNESVERTLSKIANAIKEASDV